MRKLLVLALLIVPLARADTVNSTVFITPYNDPLATDGGRIGAIWVTGGVANGFVFPITGTDPIITSGNSLSFMPGIYITAPIANEILTISTLGPRMNFLFELLDPPSEYDPLGNILTFDFRLPSTVTPELGTDGNNRFYIFDVPMKIESRPFPNPDHAAGRSNLVSTANGVVSTPEPATLVLLLVGLLFLAVRRP